MYPGLQICKKTLEQLVERKVSQQSILPSPLADALSMLSHSLAVCP